ncbi:MAG: hypothetical protein KC736_02350 [Candidatus Moranbacteria bacterium]|nr:hypothetical protein [Candidatus Moranbacteria bacterium]
MNKNIILSVGTITLATGAVLWIWQDDTPLPQEKKPPITDNQKKYTETRQHTKTRPITNVNKF